MVEIDIARAVPAPNATNVELAGPDSPTVAEIDVELAFRRTRVASSRRCR